MGQTWSVRHLTRAGLALTAAAVLAGVVAVSPDPVGAGYGYLASQQEATVFIVDTATAAYVGRTGEAFRPASYAAIEPTGATVGLATTIDVQPGTSLTGPALKVLDPSTGFYARSIGLNQTPLGAGSPQGSLALHPGGRIAYVGLAPEASIAIVDIAAQRPVAWVAVAGGVKAMAVHPAGTWLYVTGDDALSVVDTTTATVVKTVPLNHPGPLAVRPDGAFVYVVSEPRVTLSVVRTSDHTVVGTIPLPCAPTAVAPAPDSARLYVAHRGCRILSIVDTAAVQVTGTIPLPIDADGVDVDTTGTTIVAVNSGAGRDEAFVVFVDAERGTVVRTVGLTSPVFPPLGKFVGPPVPPERHPPLNESPLPPAATTRSRLVRTLYESALGRAVTPGELAAWLAFLDAHGAAAGLPALVHGILASEEMLALPVTPTVLARLLYETALGRQPETGVLTGWSAVIAEHVAALVPGFVGSPEFAQTGGALPPAALVARLYQELLGRAPSAVESAGWTSYLARTGDAGGVARAFVLSAEYVGQPRAPLEHVTGLYRALLGRDPDPASLATWVDVIAAQRAAVVAIFLRSPEFAARLATVAE